MTTVLPEPVHAALEARADGTGPTRLDAAAFAQVRAISFDEAVMESADLLAAAPLDCTRSDLGAWVRDLAAGRARTMRATPRAG